MVHQDSPAPLADGQYSYNPAPDFGTSLWTEATVEGGQVVKWKRGGRESSGDLHIFVEMLRDDITDLKRDGHLVGFEPAPAHTPRPFMRAAAVKCAHCRRELPTGEGTDIPFVGVVGPECVKKYASLCRALEAAHGMQAFEWDRGTFALAHHVVMDLRRAGVAVEVVDVRDGVKEVRIKGLARKPKVVIESWKQIREKFEQRLQLAQAEREAQDAGGYLTLTNPVTGDAVVGYSTDGVAL